MTVWLWIVLPVFLLGLISAIIIIIVVKTEDKRSMKVQVKQMKKEQQLQEQRKKIFGEEQKIVQKRSITCRYCGYANPEDLVKCQHCGAAL
ncbi:MAG TPA: hypothetical protein VMZ91_05855 [Candidatus Paceibacterota bacterium]|nr:hypothetical protein [Candidatus Paceibacterota bacterium]